MATNYTKTLKTIEIMVKGSSETGVVSDTASDAYATTALGQFLKGETMTFPDGGIVEIPFHAVDFIAVTDGDTAEYTKEDPYCGAGGGMWNDSRC